MLPIKHYINFNKDNLIQNYPLALRHTPPCQGNIGLQSPNGFLPPVTKVTGGTYHTSSPAAILKCTPITQKI